MHPLPLDILRPCYRLGYTRYDHPWSGVETRTPDTVPASWANLARTRRALWRGTPYRFQECADGSLHGL